MLKVSDDRTERDEKIEAAMVDYIAAVDAGSPPDRSAWLAGHPDIADELLVLLDDQDRIASLIIPGQKDNLETLAFDPEETCDELTLTRTDSKLRGLERDFVGPEIPERLEVVGDFRLLRVLGRGGMGVVYEAHQRSLDRNVALKMLREDGGVTSDAMRRFRNESEAIGRLDHPNLLAILEVGEHLGQRYFTMPLVEGGSLANHLEEYRADPRKAALVMVDVAEAVHHVHQRAILHRDLKPANVLLDKTGRPLVADFGLAKRLDSNDGSSLSGAVIGTPAYMSPEQASGDRESVTTATDVYGLGAILFSLLTGHPPIVGGSLSDILWRVMHEEPKRPSQLNRLVDRRLESICLKCLAKDPRRRYASAAGMAEDLRRWLRNEPIEARPIGQAARLGLWCRRRPAVAALLLVLASSAGALTITSLVAASYSSRLAHREATAAESERQAREAAVAAGDKEAELRRQAEQALRESQEVSQFLIEVFRSPDPSKDGRKVLVYDMLDRAAKRLELSYKGPKASQVNLMVALGETFRGINLNDRAEELIGKALSIGLEALPPDDPNAAEARVALAEVSFAAGKHDRAESLFREGLVRDRRVFGPDDPRTAQSLARLGVCLVDRRKYVEAEPLLRRCLALRSASDPKGWTQFRDRSHLGEALIGLQRIDDAHPLILGGYEGLKANRDSIGEDRTSVLFDAGKAVVRLHAAIQRSAIPVEQKRRLTIETERILAGSEFKGDSKAAMEHAAQKVVFNDLLDSLRNAGKGKLADEIKDRTERRGMRRGNGDKGHTIFGRVLVEGPEDPADVQAQMRILDQGYFVGHVAEAGKPVGFRLRGYQPVDVVPTAGPGSIEDVGTVIISPLEPGQQASVTGNVELEGQSGVPDGHVSMSLETGPRNGYEYEGERGISSQIYIQIGKNGRFEESGLTPSKHDVHVLVPNYWRFYTGDLDLKPGEKHDFGTIKLELADKVTITSLTSDKPIFTKSKPTTRTVYGEAFCWIADKDGANYEIALDRDASGRVGIRSHRGPFEVIDLGEGPLEDYVEADHTNRPWRNAYNARAISGHVYLARWEFAKTWVLFKLDRQKLTPEDLKLKPVDRP